MIKNFRLLLIITLTISAFSCVTTKSYEKDFSNEKLLGREQNSDVFVVKKNGEKIVGKKMTFSPSSIWKVTQKEDWIAVDGQKINKEDISVYQTPTEYKEFHKYKHTLEYESSRVRYGKINLYYKSMSDKIGTGVNQTGGSYNIYFFKKENGQVEDLSFDSFYKAVHDNDKAVQKLNSSFPKGKLPSHKDDIKILQKLISVVEIYNS